MLYVRRISEKMQASDKQVNKTILSIISIEIIILRSIQRHGQPILQCTISRMLIEVLRSYYYVIINPLPRSITHILLSYNYAFWHRYLFPAFTHFRHLLLRIRWHVIQCFIYLFIDGIIININIIKLCHWISKSSANNIFSLIFEMSYLPD